MTLINWKNYQKEEDKKQQQVEHEAKMLELENIELDNKQVRLKAEERAKKLENKAVQNIENEKMQIVEKITSIHTPVSCYCKAIS